jgi:SAM-dependent methyltransferase
MHFEAFDFLKYCAETFKEYYKGKVLDVGAADINGNNRFFFQGCEYTGCDVLPGQNVDIVMPCHELPFDKGEFDVIISSECFEHDMYWEKSLRRIMDMLKDGGLFVFTCASTGRPEHGTLRSKPADSLTTQLSRGDWGEYYRNLTGEDVLSILGNTFGYHRVYYNERSHDLYFAGIKGATVVSSLPDYCCPGVERVDQQH